MPRRRDAAGGEAQFHSPHEVGLEHRMHAHGSRDAESAAVMRPDPKTTHHRTLVMPKRPTGARPSARLGPYQLCLELGSGGMATVFLARVEGRAGSHRFVAVKCLRPELAEDPRCVEMFLEEAHISSQLHHGN